VDIADLVCLGSVGKLDKLPHLDGLGIPVSLELLAIQGIVVLAVTLDCLGTQDIVDHLVTLDTVGNPGLAGTLGSVVSLDSVDTLAAWQILLEENF